MGGSGKEGVKEGKKTKNPNKGTLEMKEQNGKNTPTTEKVRAILSAGCAPAYRRLCRFGST